jgi:hypothetical protein
VVFAAIDRSLYEDRRSSGGAVPATHDGRPRLE